MGDSLMHLALLTSDVCTGILNSNGIVMTAQSFTSRTAKAGSSAGPRRVAVVPLRPRNEKMDSLIRQIHTSGEFTFEASHARIVAAMKKATAHV